MPQIPSTILIVDDDPLGRSSLQALLSGGDYQLAFASDGSTALMMAAEALPDLLILDVKTPGMDACEITRKIRTTPPLTEMPVVLITAHDDPAARLAGIDAGVDDFIFKPFDQVELCARVRTITRLNRLRRTIQERERLDEQQRQAQKMESLALLAGGVSHDFNNLLTVIMGYSELLLDRSTLADRDRKQVGQILKTAQRAADLTHQLLAFSRKQVFVAVNLDLNALVAEMETMLRQQVGDGIELVTSLSGASVVVAADRGQVEQVILNLALNARDAMPRGGTLTIETQAVDAGKVPSRIGQIPLPVRHVRASVIDTGCGMSRETIERIFEPFFTTKEQGKGTGLGLSTVHGIVKQSRGVIEVESELGRGSRFSVYFPLASKSSVSSGAMAKVDPAAARGGTILLVDDDDGVRGMSALILEEAGYTVCQACDGDDAIRVSNEHSGKIDLLLSDLVMPKRNGPAVAEKLRSTREGLKVLFMSGYADDTIKFDPAPDENFAFLSKPFAPAALLAKVRDVMIGQLNAEDSAKLM